MSPLVLVESMLRSFDAMAAKGIALIHPAEGVGFPRDMDVDLVRTIARGARDPIAVRVFFQTMDKAKVMKRRLPRIGGCFAPPSTAASAPSTPPSTSPTRTIPPTAASFSIPRRGSTPSWPRPRGRDCRSPCTR